MNESCPECGRLRRIIALALKAIRCSAGGTVAEVRALLEEALS